MSAGVLIGNRTSTGGKGTIGHPGREDAFASVAASAITSLSRKRRGCRDGRGTRPGKATVVEVTGDGRRTFN